jgi:hypothetical protein
MAIGNITPSDSFSSDYGYRQQYGSYGLKVVGQHLYMNLTDRLQVVDVTIESSPALLGSLFSYAQTRPLAVQDGIGYFGTAEGLAVYDLQVPGLPRLIRHYDDFQPVAMATTGGLAISLMACMA